MVAARLLILLLVLAGAGLAVAGIYLLAGLAWSFLAAAALLFAAAFLLRYGMTADA